MAHYHKSRSPEQNLVLRRILHLLTTHSIWISPSYVPSSSNLADEPSRGLPAIIAVCIKVCASDFQSKCATFEPQTYSPYISAPNRSIFMISSDMDLSFRAISQSVKNVA